MFRKSRERKELEQRREREREEQERLAARPTVDCRPGFQHDTDTAVVRHDRSNPRSSYNVQETERGADWHINTVSIYCARCGLSYSYEVFK